MKVRYERRQLHPGAVDWIAMLQDGPLEGTFGSGCTRRQARDDLTRAIAASPYERSAWYAFRGWRARWETIKTQASGMVCKVIYHSSSYEREGVCNRCYEPHPRMREWMKHCESLADPNERLLHFALGPVDWPAWRDGKGES